MSFSFGADPEFILIDEKGNLKSAINVLKKDKKNKLRQGDNFFFYDNVLAECTVLPSESKREAIENIKNSLQSCAKLVSPYKLTTISSGEFNKSELLHPDAIKSGCDVEFCAYKLRTVSSKKIKKALKKSGLRTAGGHVHLGTQLGKSHETCIMLVRMLDLFLGISSLIIDQCPASKIRRKLYGSAGRYRQPKHGVEYRSLGNFWLSSPILVELIYDISEFVIESTENKIYQKFWEVDHKKLESDEFWNSDGDPANCHFCHGYDVSLLRKMFKKDKQEAMLIGKDLISLVFSIMPDNISNRIKKLEDSNFNMYKEWEINV